MSRPAAAATSLVLPAIVGAVVFVAAGRTDLPFVWGLLAVLAVFAFATGAAADPGLVKERVNPGPGSRDRLTRPVAVPLLFAHWVLAGLDVRFDWSPVPRDVQLAGLVGYAVAMAVMFWVMVTNPFYSSVVRVQADRGHHAVVSGPYQIVRHPGYAATLFGVFCGGLALGSWVALVPLVGCGVLFVRRTLIEDRMLREELPGYAEYAGRVRYRLVPGAF